MGRWRAMSCSPRRALYSTIYRQVPLIAVGPAAADTVNPGRSSQVAAGGEERPGQSGATIMADAPEATANCEDCGASIYPEHLQRRTADRWAGRLLCPHCLSEKRGGGGWTASPGSKPGGPKPSDAASEVLSGLPPISGRGRPAEGAARRPLTDGPFATRCRTFHCKMADAAIMHLNEQINEWLDHHPEVMVKFANSTVGVLEGKHNDPHLVITLFY